MRHYFAAPQQLHRTLQKTTADMALLLGTIGLFIILGVAMFFSLRLGKLEYSSGVAKKSAKATNAVAPADEALAAEETQQEAAPSPAPAETASTDE